MPGSDGFFQPRVSAWSVLVRLGDSALIVIAHFLAIYAYGEEWRAIHSTSSAIAVLVFQFAGGTLGLYPSMFGQPLRRELTGVWAAWFALMPMLLLLAFISKTSADFSRVITLGWFVAAPVSIALWRMSLRYGGHKLRERGRNIRATAIVGMTPLGERVAQVMRQSPWLGLKMHGFYDDRNVNRCCSIPEDLGQLKGGLDELVTAARNGELDLIYIALPLRAEPRVQELLRKLADTTASVYVAADFYTHYLLHRRWGVVGDVPVVSVHETPFYGVDGWLKRAEDIVLGCAIMVLITIPMMVIAVAVKLSSKGPVFFRQRRYGLNGEVIDILKFRSMTVTEDGDDLKQAVRDDPRVTKVGAFIRSTSLDELPQFIHVITGKMSIVGPRPHAVKHNEVYRTKIPGYMLRHKVKPGITGWAQVNGWRGETDTLEKMEKRVEHDLHYIRNWDLLWDLKIIFMTVFGSAARRNAY